MNMKNYIEFIKNNDIEHEQDELDLDVALQFNGFYEEDEGDNVEGDPKSLDDGTMPNSYVMYAMSVEKGTFFDGIITLTKPFDSVNLK